VTSAADRPGRVRGGLQVPLPPWTFRLKAEATEAKNSTFRLKAEAADVERRALQETTVGPATPLGNQSSRTAAGARRASTSPRPAHQRPRGPPWHGRSPRAGRLGAPRARRPRALTLAPGPEAPAPRRRPAPGDLSSRRRVRRRGPAPPRSCHCQRSPIGKRRSGATLPSPRTRSSAWPRPPDRRAWWCRRAPSPPRYHAGAAA
jgi:hypothetical protein